MKKGNRMWLIAGISLLVMSLSGCNKLLDYVNGHGKGAPGVSKYRIKTIAGWDDHDSARATFTYNQWGDPVEIWLDRPTTGRGHSLFRYDQARKLTDFINTYDGEYYEHWNKYVYDRNGRVIQDTLYQLGEMGSDGPKSFEHKLVADYNYDSYGRIIKVKTTVMVPGHYEFEDVYTYDIKGNRTWHSPPDTIDNKVNLLRTHPVWQLVDKDYSMNNPFIADMYNESRLPVKLHVNSESGVFYFLRAWVPGKRWK
ncbi:hypothetical protein [Paraflavitalea speifideaquila]|uniref:hypothetical protein n=1 Tax=Paraflavitalea speifideaquila TaxID=3076558 RepID=UPI0028E70069|nr:hypothetical protein [Paraflavitalea speifideiaquila]